MDYAITKNEGLKAGISPALYRAKKHDAVSRFFSWCEGQEGSRFLWLALTFFLQIGMIVPMAAYSIIFFGGNNMALWVVLVVVNVPTLVLNLAALSTKITLPFLFFAWLTEFAIIFYCLSQAL